MRWRSCGAEARILERLVEEVGAKGGDHLEVHRVRSGRPDDHVEERPALLVGRDVGVELLELVDHQHHRRSVRQPAHCIVQRQPTGTESLDQARRLPGGHPGEGGGELVERADPREHVGDQPLFRAGRAPDLTAGHQSRPHHRRLPDPGGPDHHGEATRPHPLHQLVDQRVPTEEVGGVGLGEGAEPLVRVPGIGARRESRRCHGPQPPPVRRRCHGPSRAGPRIGGDGGGDDVRQRSPNVQGASVAGPGAVEEIGDDHPHRVHVGGHRGARLRRLGSGVAARALRHRSRWSSRPDPAR